MMGGGWGDLAGNDLGTGSGWKQSRQNQTPLCSDETRSPSSIAHLDTALAARLHLLFALSLDGSPRRGRHGPRAQLDLSKSPPSSVAVCVGGACLSFTPAIAQLAEHLTVD